MIKNSLSCLEAGHHLYYCQRFSRVALYGGPDRANSMFLAECHCKTHGKNIELILDYKENKTHFFLNSNQERRGLAKLLTPPFYQGEYCTEGPPPAIYSIAVRSLDLPYINACSVDDGLYIGDKDSQKKSLGYVMNSTRFGTMIDLLPDNSFSIREIVDSCFGAGKIKLGVWRLVADDNLAEERYLTQICDVVLILIFTHILVLPLVISDSSGGYS